MEITNELEIRVLVTARKIRMFNESMAQQKALGVTDEMLQSSIVMRDELEREFQRLSEQLRAATVAA